MRRLALLSLLAGCGRLGFEDTPPAPDASLGICDPQPATDTVALYTFEGGLEGALGADATTLHDARVVGAVESTSAPCGSGGAQFAGGHLIIADSPAFDLAEGSIELYVNAPVPDTGTTQGILSRDANGTDFDGHFSLAIAPNGQLWVRMQRTAGNVSVHRCSEPLTANRWTHVGVSFGPQGFHLWIDGVEPVGTSVVSPGGSGAIVTCDVPHVFGIDGNDNVWALGGLIFTDTNGNPDPVPTSPLTGAVDQLRIRSTWHDFTAP